ncbi:hypothetical protein AA103581_2173 [Gluconobacter wancherniae NBRC 103581]|nr:hypothetical protein AA103581_2173 [Gluconobacter wancherniae NBRC 103581]
MGMARKLKSNAALRSCSGVPGLMIQQDNRCGSGNTRKCSSKIRSNLTMTGRRKVCHTCHNEMIAPTR